MKLLTFWERVIMEKIEAIVDTCFLKKLAPEERNVENIRKVINCLNIQPVAHPYIVEHEISLISYLKKLVDANFIKKIKYSEFLKDETDSLLYENNFFLLHEQMRQKLDAIPGCSKKIEKLDLRAGQTIYNTHRQGSSMGDVHMILMAALLRLPIILTEDSDIELIRGIVRAQTQFAGLTIQIYDSLDILKKIAENADAPIIKKELFQIINSSGERSHRAELSSIWDANH